uniref:Uncharacterized protein n=1 Tax=Arundo donax TaxID=35708 RepID=A0A0A9AI71_ARUDO
MNCSFLNCPLLKQS